MNFRNKAEKWRGGKLLLLYMAGNTTIYEITRIPEKIMLLKTTELGNGYLNIMLMDIFISA